MKKSLLSVVGILSAAFVFAGVVSAAPAGQIEGGDIYRVRNVSTNSAFVDPATGTCGNTFQFKVRVHNPGPDALANVNVKATLPTTEATSHSSQVTVTASNANPASTSDTAGVTLDKAAKLSYINGSTELLDANGAKLLTLGDTIFTSGVTIDTVGVSTQQKRFVQFSVKADCPAAPVEKCPVPGKEHLPKNSPDCKNDETPVVPGTPSTPATPALPAELPETGIDSTLVILLGLGALTAAITYAVTSRKNVLG